MRNLYRHQFDIHIAHGCNFSCDSCSHFSNYHFAGILSLNQAELWYSLWSRRIMPFKINLLGGEPAIHPQLSEHVLLARQYWPTSTLYLYTNGFLLSRHGDQLPAALGRVENAVVRLSRHYNGSDYDRQFDEVVSLLEEWKRNYGVRFEIMNSFSTWTRRYNENKGLLSPFQDGNSRKSWESCKAKYCVQLHEGKLWKCPMLAYLPMATQHLRITPEFAQCLNYKALSSDCSDAELAAFLSAQDEPYCAACPAYPSHLTKIDPTPNGQAKVESR